METFVVRVYRGIDASAQELAGTVERVGSGDRVGFSCGEELLEFVLGRHGRGDADQNDRDRRNAGGRGEDK